MKTINEVNSDDVNIKPFKVKQELNPKFFNNEGKLNSQIRMRLLDIADDFVKTLEIKWVKPNDIVLTGSIANYNWSNYSDVDIHVIYNFKDIYTKTEFVKNYVDAKKEQWNQSHTELTIKGFPVELSVEDSANPAKSTGVYSLEKNKWVKEPENLNDSKLNKEYIKNFCAKQMTKLDDLFKEMDEEKDRQKLQVLSDKVETIYTKLKNMRKEGLATKEKEMSTGNIIWKVVKHAGYIAKLWKYINKVYDRRNTIDEKKKVVRISESQARMINEYGNPGFGNVYLNSWLSRFRKALGSSSVTTPQLHNAIQAMGIKQVIPGVYRKNDLNQVLSNISPLKRMLGIEPKPEWNPTPSNIPVVPDEIIPDDEDEMPAANMDNFINLSDVSELNEGLCELSSKTYQSAASKAYNKGKYDIDDADDRVKKFRQAAIDQLRFKYPYYFHHLEQDREDKQEEYVTNNNNQKIIIFDPDYSTLQDLYKGVKQGKLLIHCREINENDIPNILYPGVGETVQDAYGCEYGEEEIPNLIFASENFIWAQNYPTQHSNYSDHRNGVFFVYGDNFEKNIGDGYIQDITGRIYRSGDTPLTVETDDWFSSEPVDVAGVLIINDNKLNGNLLSEAAMPQFNLQTLDSLKSFKKRLDYCKQMLGPTFGSGSSRIIFEIDDEKVLKLAKNQKGIAQNEFEDDTARYSSCVVKVFECSNDYTWLVEENCIPAKEDDFERILGLPFETYCDLVRFYYNRYCRNGKQTHLYTMSSDEADKMIDEIYEQDEYGFIPTLFDLMGTYQLPFGDLTRISTYGMVKRDGDTEIVVIDSGLSEEILNTYYRRR